MHRSGSVIEALVLEANRGGVVVDVGLRGFVPLSQLVSIGPIDTRERDIPEPVKALVGERLQVCVLERGTAQLSTGDVLSGTVVGLTSYGLFVDVGVADGLVHRSEITWGKGADLTSLYPLGTSVRVVVVDVDRERQRISLSIKRTGADPWERYVNELETGQTVAATVMRVMPYGASARLADGVEGLIHVTSLPAKEWPTRPIPYTLATYFRCGSWPSTASGGACPCLLAFPSAHETLSGGRSRRSPNV